MIGSSALNLRFLIVLRKYLQRILWSWFCVFENKQLLTFHFKEAIRKLQQNMTILNDQVFFSFGSNLQLRCGDIHFEFPIFFLFANFTTD